MLALISLLFVVCCCLFLFVVVVVVVVAAAAAVVVVVVVVVVGGLPSPVSTIQTKGPPSLAVGRLVEVLGCPSALLSSPGLGLLEVKFTCPNRCVTCRWLDVFSKIFIQVISIG